MQLLKQRHEATGISKGSEDCQAEVDVGRGEDASISEGSEDCQADVDVGRNENTARAEDDTLKQSMAGSGGKKRSSEKKGES
jgi:hypothetical protein